MSTQEKIKNILETYKDALFVHGYVNWDEVEDVLIALFQEELSKDKDRKVFDFKKHAYVENKDTEIIDLKIRVKDLSAQNKIVIERYDKIREMVMSGEEISISKAKDFLLNNIPITKANGK